jgi:DNA (cytosine-5)-methyltransferase 1
MKPRLLDLFCGAGGAAMGYHRAGFEVVGVDIKPQPHYPFAFIRGDALEVIRLATDAEHFDVIHASPPCQAYTSMRHLGKRAGEGAPDLVDATRDALEATGVPWVMENVMGSPLRNPLTLCGSTFLLEVRRHRLFESSHLLFGSPCQHGAMPRPIAVYGDHPQQPGDKTYRVNRARTLHEGQRAMGIDWMPWKSLTQAIPPAYTEWIGRQLLQVVERAA